MVLLLCQMIAAYPLTSADPYWIGSSSSFGTTEGNDFWVTFMNNGMFNPETSPEITFKLEIAVSVRQETKVFFEIPGQTPIERTVPANQTYIEDFSDSYAVTYLYDSEDASKYKGVHVYTEDKDKLFSCFCYNRNGEASSSSRDVSLVLPTEFLGKEYYIQTSPEDVYSSEFAIVATEDNTTLTIIPAFATATGKPKDVPFTVVLEKAGDAYLVSSKQQTGDEDFNVDLTGSRICADKPIAVYNGNQQTSNPIDDAYSKDYSGEQILPISQWGTDFYLSVLDNTTENYYRLTAGYDGTEVTIRTYDKNGNTDDDDTFTLDAGKSIDTYTIDKDYPEVVIHCSKPVVLFDYTTSAALNRIKVGGTNFSMGDPSNAMLPAWNHRVKSMNFSTKEMDPQMISGKKPPQYHYVYLVTTTANINNITVDGTSYGTLFKPFHGEPTMSYAHIPLVIPEPDTHYHAVESSGDGFVGMVYSLTHAQCWFNTLGFSPQTDPDTLFVENTEAVMAPKSYDLERVPDKGWYQRQWNEWMQGHERLDTAQVCDSTIIYWAIQTPKTKQVGPVEWYIYDVTDGSAPSDANQKAYWKDDTPSATVGDNNIFRRDTMFTLPDESDLEPQDRIPFMEYEIRAIMHRPHLICTDLEDEVDTMRTAVRVTRVYHDTIYRIICMGDTLKCFYDSLPHQKYHGLGPANELDNVTETVKVGPRDSTMFIGDKTPGDKTENFQWKATSGENIFSRHYLTRFGCDSTYTLFLFVCDTFRFDTTFHLCKNERFTYQDSTYRGIESEETGKLVTTDTVSLHYFKTTNCECQANPKYPTFEGCDSIWEVHIILHEIHRDTLIDTMCYNRNPAAKYEWSIQKGTQKKYIGKDDPNMNYDAGLRAWWGFFSDTLRTTTCPKCNDGKGCDSINVLKLYIPEPFYNKDTLDSICTGWYDFEKHKIIHDESNKYYWAGHRNGNVTGDYLPSTGTYYDSCLTRFGCDSIYTLHLRYDDPYLGTNSHSMANNQTYKWSKTGLTYGPFPELEGVLDTTLYFYVSQTDKTKHGCDSVWRLDLRISDTYLFQETRRICDIDSIHWRDTIILGYKWDGTEPTEFIRLKNKLYTAVDDSLKTIELPVRDSIYRLNVYQYPTYENTLPKMHICQDSTYFDWKREDNGALIKHIVFPVKSSYPFDTVYTDTLYSKSCTTCNEGKGCDSILHLPVRIYPTYYHLNYDTVCQHKSAKYNWTTAEGFHTDTIPTDKTGNFVYWDSAFTASCHCDSVYELRLTVLPSYYFIYTDTISEEKAYTWTANGKIYGGTKYTGTKNVEVPLGLYTETISKKTVKIGTYDCDSIHELHLLVGPVYRDTLDTFTCATATSYEWKGIDKNGDEFVRKTITGSDLPDSKTHKLYYDSLKTYLNFDSIFVLDLYRAPSYIKEENGTVCQNKTFTWVGHDTVTIKTAHAGDFDFYDYLKTDSFECDSTWILHLHVDTVYNELTDTAVCQSTDPFVWLRHAGHTLWDKQKNIHITDVSKAHCGTYEFIDSLTTVAGCDSIWTLRLRVDTVYSVPVEETKRAMCDKDTLHFYGEVIYGSKSSIIGDTKITVPAAKRDTTFERFKTVSSVHGCDSIVKHVFTVYKTYELTKVDSICQNSSYTWIDHTTRDLWDVRQNKRIAPDAIPTNLKSGVVYTYIDSTRTQNCPACNGGTGGCDSIWILQLRVDSVYDNKTTKTISDENTYIWDGKIYIGSKVDKDTITSTLPQVDIPEGSVINNYANPYQTIHKCDSTERLELKVGPTFRDTIWDETCDNVPYKWHHAGDPDPEHYARTDIEILNPGTYYDSLKTKEFGFDSIYVLILTNIESYNTDTTDTVICQNYAPFVWKRHEGRTIWDKKHNKHVSADNVPTGESGTFYYIDTMKAVNGCDSIWTLQLYVAPTYKHTDPIRICANDTMSWQGMLLVGSQFGKYGGTYDPADYDSVRMFYSGYHERTIRRGTKGFDCDSMFYLQLTVDSIHRDTIERRACQDAGTYHYENWNNGAGGDIPAAHLSDSQVRNDTLKSKITGCDSIVTLYFYVDSVYHFGRRDTVCQAYGQEWTWYEDGIPQATISIDEGDKTFVLGTNYTTMHGCDSTYGITVYVAPIYHFYDTIPLCENDSAHWHDMLFTGSQYTAYGKTCDPAAFDSCKLDLSHGEYHTNIKHKTKITDCDSIYHLTLYVHEVAHTDSLDSVCQGTPFFNPNWNWGTGMYMDTRFVGTYTSVDTIYSKVTGCDSIVTLTLRVDSVYDYRQVVKVCQDTVNTQWEWFDDETGDSHGYIDISKAIDIDKTDAYTTIHGCDSVYGIKLHIAPIYRFDSVRHICQNERVVWQKKRYTGNAVTDMTTPDDSIVLAPGIHYDTAHYTTWEGCDSTYYLVLHVHDIYDVATTVATTCDNETYHWYQQDINGSYDEIIYTAQPYDTIRLSVDQAKAAADDPIVDGRKDAKPTQVFNQDHMLHTIHGCDSLTHLELTVHPTYFFYTDSTMCSDQIMNYRGQYFDGKKDTTYTERLTTAAGCDSIYQLHLHIKPAWLKRREIHICEDESVYADEDGRKIWEPGDPEPGPFDYTDISYTTKEGCDSTYRYVVQVHHKFYDEKNATLCSNDSVIIQGSHYVGPHILYDVYHYYLPFDTVFIDSLKTISCIACRNGVGCDSVYRLNVHVLPQYYNLVEDTICASETYAWRDSVFTHMTPGLYSFKDSFQTEEYGCDSVYELRLYVAPTYFSADTITKCADDDLTWREHNLDHIAPGAFLIYDSLLTEGFRCDSVFHLYLTVIDTTREVNYDTICYNDTLHVLDHMYTVAGDYKDTTLNDAGCRHFIYTHLAIIPPTIPTAWADSMCSQDDAFDLYYTYTSHAPIAFSLYYDDLGHEMGFEDMISVPVTEYSDPMIITIPITLRDGDRTKYPRPDHYRFRLVLDNGMCQRPEEDCFVDSIFVMSYPVWLTEQRHSDVIALLNEQYNGGYSWEEYQWYHGDSMLVGQTKPYLYIPGGLVVGDQYYVRLTRTGEEEDFQTCPVTAVSNPIVNDYAPTMSYLSVVPTCVVTGHPYVNILSRKDGKYRITTTEGLLIGEGDFQADATQVAVPAIEGMYIFQLWSKDTPEEPYRAIKVIVRQQCPNCDISSF